MSHHSFLISLAFGVLLPGSAFGADVSLPGSAPLPDRSLATHWASVGFHRVPGPNSVATRVQVPRNARFSPPDPFFGTDGAATHDFPLAESCAPVFDRASFLFAADEVFRGTFVGWGKAVSLPAGQPGPFSPGACTTASHPTGKPGSHSLWRPIQLAAAICFCLTPGSTRLAALAG